MSDGTVTIPYFDAIQRLIEKTRAEHTFTNVFVSAALVHKARNAFVSRVLNEAKYTHLLFIDSDIGFRPEAIERMIAFDKPFVGCICPARSMDFERFHRIARQIEDPALARAVAQNYVAAEGLVRTDFGEGKGSGYVLDRGFARTTKIGAGLTLIKREALELMRERFPDLVAESDGQYRGMGVNGPVFQGFEALKAENGVFLSEDLAFCQRWVEGCGGQIWACVDEVVSHTGQVSFSGKLIDRIRHSDLK